MTDAAERLREAIRNGGDAELSDFAELARIHLAETDPTKISGDLLAADGWVRSQCGRFFKLGKCELWDYFDDVWCFLYGDDDRDWKCKTMGELRTLLRLSRPQSQEGGERG